MLFWVSNSLPCMDKATWPHLHPHRNSTSASWAIPDLRWEACVHCSLKFPSPFKQNCPPPSLLVQLVKSLSTSYPAGKSQYGSPVHIETRTKRGPSNFMLPLLCWGFEGMGEMQTFGFYFVWNMTACPCPCPKEPH